MIGGDTDGVGLIWEDEWNNIIREKFFKNPELKQLLMLPEKTNIMDFIDKYFVRRGGAGPLLTDQKVRIVYAFSTAKSGGQNPYVVNQQVTFNIYVKSDCVHNAVRDRLVYRTVLIANKIKDALMSKRYNGSYRFWLEFEGDAYTSLVEYNRYDLVLNFEKVAY